MDIHERFESMNDEYLKFERIENPRTTRPDLHAFLLLDELSPSKHDIVGNAQHDQIYLDFPATKLDEVSDDLLRDLIRCGVRYDSEFDCLAMFT